MKPNLNQIEVNLNMTLYPEYAAAVLCGDTTNSIFPRMKIIQDDENDEFLYFTASVLVDNRDREGSLVAEITFEVSTGTFSYGLFEYAAPVVSRGELIDPGGWEIDENTFKGPFKTVADLAKSMKADFDANEARIKAENEAEMEYHNQMKQFSLPDHHKPYPEYCPVCGGTCLYDADPELR